MEQRFLNSNRTVAAASTLHYVYDIRRWIEPCLEEIHKHTNPHVFLFRRNRDGKGVMFYKHWSADEWCPAEGLVLLKVCLVPSHMLSFVVMWPFSCEVVGLSVASQMCLTMTYGTPLASIYIFHIITMSNCNIHYFILFSLLIGCP